MRCEKIEPVLTESQTGAVPTIEVEPIVQRIVVIFFKVKCFSGYVGNASRFVAVAVVVPDIP